VILLNLDADGADPDASRNRLECLMLPRSRTAVLLMLVLVVAAAGCVSPQRSAAYNRKVAAFWKRMLEASASPTASATSAGAIHARQEAPRDPALWPFSVTSPFNTPIGTGAQFSTDTDPRTQTLRWQSGYINAAQWSQPIYIASPNDPFTTVSGTTFRIPPGAKPSLPQGGDQNLHIIDPTRRWVDEMWLASGSGTNWTAGYHVRNDLTGPGVGGRGVRAAGVSAIGGLIRTWELQAGVIRHALAMALPRSANRVGYIWPATSEDYDAAWTYGGNIPLGTLVAIPPTVNINNLGLSPQGLVIARALQQFGAYNLDSAGGLVFYAEPDSEALLGPARADLAKIIPHLRVVLNNTPTTPGGGGTPTAPPAPPLAQ
jgi:hypothetical protein